LTLTRYLSETKILSFESSNYLLLIFMHLCTCNLFGRKYIFVYIRLKIKSNSVLSSTRFNISTILSRNIYRMWPRVLGRWTQGLAIGAAMYQWCEFKSRRGKNTVRFNFQTYIYNNLFRYIMFCICSLPAIVCIYIGRGTNTH
jgi:hypothetical protein